MSTFLYDWHPILLVVGVVIGVLVFVAVMIWHTERSVEREHAERTRRVVEKYRLPQGITWREVRDIEDAEDEARRAEGRAAARRIVEGHR